MFRVEDWTSGRHRHFFTSTPTQQATTTDYLFAVASSSRKRLSIIMGNDDLLTDDYVANMLADEAKDCSLKYSTIGMEAYTSSSSSSSRFATHDITPCRLFR